MKKVYIWGAGNHLKAVYEAVDQEQCIVLGIIDNDGNKQGKKVWGDLIIFSPECLDRANYDYIIISVEKFQRILQDCLKMGIPRSKIIVFWENENKPFLKYSRSIKYLENLVYKYKIRIENLPYESRKEPEVKIRSATELLNLIIANKLSLCRFGDGEFESIRGRERAWFQKTDKTLSCRLKEVLDSDDPNVIVAIADNFGTLERYTEQAADGIRSYLYGDTRKDIISLLNRDRTYYDAYVTRPYMIYKDRKNADEIFPLFKKVWKDRDVVIVEGEYARIGIGNDLMEQANSVSRILCPSQNAWGIYDRIFNWILENVSAKSLVCISLGPCATILAYDLAKKGYQALDIGQLDNEYEWYLQNADKRVGIPGKMVAEYKGEQDLAGSVNGNYKAQVIAKIV